LVALLAIFISLSIVLTIQLLSEFYGKIL
jgi:hypothetical protein